MPSVSATLIDLLTYLAPGFVVLYGLRRQSDTLQTLFSAVATEHGLGPLLALSITAIAIGLIVAGIAHLLVPWLARLTTFDRTRPLHKRDLDFGRLYTQPAATLELFQQMSRTFQSYANMATALLISLGVLFYNWRDGQVIDHLFFKSVFHSAITFLMFCASIRYFRRLYVIAHSLSQVQNNSPVA